MMLSHRNLSYFAVILRKIGVKMVYEQRAVGVKNGVQKTQFNLVKPRNTVGFDNYTWYVRATIRSPPSRWRTSFILPERRN